MKDFILVNKPEGWTSFDVVGFLRNKIKKENPELKNIKVGHAGTLDPFATGLLIVGIGREATKRLDEFKNLPKTYLTTIHLGATSNTDDKTGEISLISEKEPLTKEVEKTLADFVGKQQQIPPMFSAKKVAGQRLYKLARKGETIERQPDEIEIHSLKLLSYSYPLLKIEVACSTGTYIRTLARDIGEKLGVGAYCEELVRTAIGEYNLKDAKKPSDSDILKIS
ncbi:MAG: tRNA pseudouridine(55) synthase TruB [Patescibacteria group bacterium]|jgi:tRNA pseudouridine55 synthase